VRDDVLPKLVLYQPEKQRKTELNIYRKEEMRGRTKRCPLASQIEQLQFITGIA
jgi:hypothetical protein